jgi:membrane protein involved in colicin uptake
MDVAGETLPGEVSEWADGTMARMAQGEKLLIEGTADTDVVVKGMKAAYDSVKRFVNGQHAKHGLEYRQGGTQEMDWINPANEGKWKVEGAVEAETAAQTKMIRRAKEEVAAALTAEKGQEEQATKEQKQKEQTKKEQEEQAKKAQEEKAKQEAEEQAKQAQEEQAKQEAEEQAKQEAEEQAKQEAEEQIKKDAEIAAMQQVQGPSISSVGLAVHCS